MAISIILMAYLFGLIIILKKAPVPKFVSVCGSMRSLLDSPLLSAMLH